MATIGPAELARMRVVYQVPGMDQVEVRRNLVYHEADVFVQAGLAAGVELELWNHAAGQHGFDVLDDAPRTCQIAARTIEFIRTHCGARGGAEDRR